MKNYACPKCGSIDVFLKESGTHIGLYCSDGCGWIKWISAKEKPIVEEFIKENKEPAKVEVKSVNGISTLQDYYKQKKFELEIDNSSFNRGVAKGLEIALIIMGVE